MLQKERPRKRFVERKIIDISTIREYLLCSDCVSRTPCQTILLSHYMHKNSCDAETRTAISRKLNHPPWTNQSQIHPALSAFKIKMSKRSLQILRNLVKFSWIAYQNSHPWKENPLGEFKLLCSNLKKYITRPFYTVELISYKWKKLML